MVIFAKRPRPGEVKTRLAAALGPQAAAAVYRELLAGVLHRLSGATDWTLSLAVTPDEAVGESQAWPQDTPRWPQGGGDLGARLERALAGAARDAPVMVVGSDVPGVTAETVRAALAALASVDLVLGPAPDGGYWLIGASRAGPPGWLSGVRWSSAHARADTLARAQAAGLRAAVLDLWLEDVDELEGYRRWRSGA